MNKIVKTVLEHPEYIDTLLESSLVADDAKVKLEKVQNVYRKTKQIPWKALEHEFEGIETENADLEYFFESLEQEGLLNFNLALKDKASKGLIQPTDLEELKQQYIKTFTEVIETEFELGDDIVSDLKTLAKKKAKQNKKTLKTGYKRFDESLDGGLRSGGIYCFMGPTGTYKSTFLTNFARSIWEQEKNVLYISTEMSHIDTFERIVRSYSSKTSLDEIALSAHTETFPKAKIKVVKVHPYDTRTMELINIIQSLDWKPDVLVVDYADELLPDKYAEKDYDAQGIVYAGLKTIGEMFEIPVLTATQTNREPYDKEYGGTKPYYGMEAISDSSKKARLMDALFAIIRTAADKNANQLHLLTIKSRFSGHAELDFVINHNFWRINEHNGFGAKGDPGSKEEKPEHDEKEYVFRFLKESDVTNISIYNTIIRENLSPSDGQKYLREKMRRKDIDKGDYDALTSELRNYRRFLDETKKG